MAEVDDDLDYHIIFPSPNIGESDGDAVDDSDIIRQREPVVILLGWAGCQDKHLAKYSSFYEQKGFITIRYIAPTEHIFFEPEKLRSTAMKILELILEFELEESPVFFHIFSNGGGSVYRYISEILEANRKDQMIKVAGTMFDSCPSSRSIKNAIRVYTMTQKITGTMVYVWGFFLFFYFLCLRLWGFVSSFFQDQPADYWQAMKRDSSRWPQLYLFSKADTLVNYKSVESIIRYRKSLGVHVESVCWDDSAHVCHLVTHRESYIKHCLDFTEFCLQKI